MKFISVLRSNWKKTVFGVALGAYAIHYGQEMYQISALMTSYSKAAALYGERHDQYPRKIIVILNPAAKKKTSEKTFRKYCEPILHLAGFMVDIVRTDSEGYAKTYIEQLKSLPNAVVIAGGDGTVSEVLTGMMRRDSGRCPIAVLPLGIRNEVAKRFLSVSLSSKLEEVESLINAAMTIVQGYVAEKSVIKIEQVSSQTDEHPETRPIYAMGYIQWGINRDLKSLQEKYWYFGKAKTYCSVLLNAFNRNLTWVCKANVCYSSPCIGCTNCIHSENKNTFKRTRWTNFLLKNNVLNNTNLVSNNNDCKREYNDEIDSSNVRIYVDDTSELNKLVLEKQEKYKPGYDFLYKYFSEMQILTGEDNKRELILCRTMKLIPDENCKGSTKFYSIDNEVYDVRPISVTLIPKAIQLYMQI